MLEGDQLLAPRRRRARPDHGVHGPPDPLPTFLAPGRGLEHDLDGGARRLLRREGFRQGLEAGAGLEALAEALATQEAAGPPVEVVLETAPGSQEGWERIGRSVDAVVWPGTPAAGREELVALKHTTLRSPAEASAWLASHQRSARPELPVLQLEELRHA